MQFQYRLRRQLERIGDLELSIECLENLNETIDQLFNELDRTGNASLLEELCPYFGTVWPSARALAERLAESRQPLAGRRILEVGCGLALPTILAARLGAEVTATDFHPEVPRFLERNLALNQVRGVTYLRVDWKKDFPDLGLFDWVIGSDVLYESQHALLLPPVVDRYLAPTGQALFADPARPYLQGFVDAMSARGFRHETEIRTAADTPVPKDIFLIRLWR